MNAIEAYARKGIYVRYYRKHPMKKRAPTHSSLGPVVSKATE